MGGEGELNGKESLDSPRTVRRSNCPGNARPGSSLDSPWLSCPRSQTKGESSTFRTRGALCLCALEPCAHGGRQVALVSWGAPPQLPSSSYRGGFRADPELGPEPG